MSSQPPSDQPISICCTGFPSAGKSMLINSFMGVRRLVTSLVRSTVECKKINKKLISDDGVEFYITDLPGINDASDSKKEFNELTYKEIVNHDIILWCSDINGAFLTDYEKKEVDVILKILRDDTIANSRSHELVILLTKCNVDIKKETDESHKHTNANVEVKKGVKKFGYPEDDDDYELSGDETASYVDVYNKVCDIFKSENIRVMCFNAFGRIHHFNDNMSEELKKLVRRICTPTNNNIYFELKWYVNNNIERKNRTQLMSFSHNYISFLEKLSSDWSVVKCHVTIISAILMLAEYSVFEKIIFAFLCRCDKIEEFLEKNCYYPNTKKIAYSDANTIKTLSLIYELKDVAKNAAMCVLLENPKKLRDFEYIKTHYEICKYWLLFSHSLIYYTKYYECFSRLVSCGGINIKLSNNSSLCIDISYINSGCCGTEKCDVKPESDKTCAPLLAWYDYRVSEGNACVADPKFVQECKSIYKKLYNADIDINIAITRAFVENKADPRNLVRSIFQKCSYNSVGLDIFITSLCVENNSEDENEIDIDNLCKKVKSTVQVRVPKAKVTAKKTTTKSDTTSK